MAETQRQIFFEQNQLPEEPTYGDPSLKEFVFKNLGLGKYGDSEPNFLGLHIHKNKPWLGYYVGLTWLDEKEKLWIGSKPKIDQLDYWRMFNEALSDPTTFNHLQEQTKDYRMIYGIDMDAPLIPCSDKTLDPLPLLYFHFLQTVKTLVHYGLRKSYRTETKSLQGRLKGKVLVGSTLKQHHIKEHLLDRAVCQYQIHTVDTDENRYLKAALNAVLGLAGNTFSSGRKEHSAITNLALANLVAFETVADALPLQVPKARNIGFYRHYHSALKLAEMILKRRSQQISGAATQGLPPFYLNMPLLFEIWVFGQLKKKNPLLKYTFQAYKTDILDIENKSVIDAKYILLENEELTDKIRSQVFTYARNINVRKEFSEQGGPKISDNEELKCLIIYPIPSNDAQIVQGGEVEDKQYSNLYKQSITVPMVT